MGKGIKTRSVADKTIKAIDKAAVASERMKEAYIRTKDKADHSLYAEESSPGEYASDRLSALFSLAVSGHARAPLCRKGSLLIMYDRQKQNSCRRKENSAVRRSTVFLFPA